MEEKVPKKKEEQEIQRDRLDMVSRAQELVKTSLRRSRGVVS